MDWKLFGSTFVVVFVAELGDKTQLATLSLASGASSRWMVFIGAATALVVTSALAVLGAEALIRVIDPIWLRRFAGASLVVLGILFLVTRGDAPPAGTTPAGDAPSEAGTAETAGPPAP